MFPDTAHAPDTGPGFADGSVRKVFRFFAKL